MTRVVLLSDTHGYLHEAISSYCTHCDEVWHAGDFGICMPPNIGEPLLPLPQVGVWQADYFSKWIGKKVAFKGVYGNIDNAAIRANYPEQLHFSCEQVKVYMQHIGGYPGRYSKGVAENIVTNHTTLFISGHSHILKIMYDKKLGCLHMNPGAAGNQGWHKQKTLIRFVIDGSVIKDCEVITL